MRQHPQEEAISIIHHGRNRAKLLPLVWENHIADHCISVLSPAERWKVSKRALEAVHKLTPANETKIRAESILKYIDLDKVNDVEFLYTYSQIQAAIYRLWQQPEEIEDDIVHWLRARGVTDRQLMLFRSFSQVKTREDRIALGIEIHPALQRWIGNVPIRGVAYPATPGVHLRFLSTVPKIKFGASVPMLHMGTNRLFISPQQFQTHGLWLVEGLFDGLALDSLGICYCSPSSGTWSAEQLEILLAFIKHHKPLFVVCAHDGDRVGLKENLFLWSVLHDWHKDVRVFLYPPNIKDMAELVCKHHKDPRDIGPADPITVAEHYLAQPYEELVDFDRYLDHRNTAYSNDRYLWNPVS